MLRDDRDPIEVLKFELDFIEKRGYGRSARTPRLPTSVFQDSMTCLNFGDPLRTHPCQACLLMRFVPPERRSEDVPCHCIPLNEAQETIETLSGRDGQGSLEEAVRSWLKKTIERLEGEKGANAAKKIREIVAEMPSSVSVLEELGIDYCCGGDQPLEEACLQHGLSLREVVSLLEANESSTGQQVTGERDWNAEPLTELMSNIVNKHHQFTRQALREVRALLPKVCAKHADNHPELRVVESTFQDLDRELTGHMFKEEMILFPAIEEAEESVRTGRPRPCLSFGSFGNPVHVMIEDHDHAGENLRRIRELAAGYVTPPDACASFRALYEKLKVLEEDLHYHIYLENYVLFPRALAMEEAV